MSKICNINVDCLDDSYEAKCDTKFMTPLYQQVSHDHAAQLHYFGKTMQINSAMMLILSHATLTKNNHVCYLRSDACIFDVTKSVKCATNKYTV